MTNIPHRAGDRYRCFVLVKPDLTYTGPYGQRSSWPVWRCEDCGYQMSATYDTFAGVRRWSSYDMARMADHHDCGHAPCDYCGGLLLRRKDGTPRQHAANRCPAKTEGHLIVREFAKNVERREFA